MNLARKYDPTHNAAETLDGRGEWLREKRIENEIDFERKHLNIGVVAKEIGVAGLFYGINGFLSKLVHPTALSILLDVDREREHQLREGVMGIGVGGAEDALRHIVAFCEQCGMRDCALA